MTDSKLANRKLQQRLRSFEPAKKARPKEPERPAVKTAPPQEPERFAVKTAEELAEQAREACGCSACFGGYPTSCLAHVFLAHFLEAAVK